VTLVTDLEPAARPATAILHLGGRASFREAPELRAAVFQAIEVARDKNLVIDLERVESLDTAAMAVLVEALMETKGSDTTVFLLHPSRAVQSVFRMAGLAEALTQCCDCWEDIAAAMA
jgi:anti-sigma B factor antagonist